MTEYEAAKKKWKEEIGFDTLQFPLYKKSADLKEFYRFNSVHEVVELRTKFIKHIGLSNNLSEALFVEICKWYQPCTAEEFNKEYAHLKTEIDKIEIHQEELAQANIH